MKKEERLAMEAAKAKARKAVDEAAEKKKGQNKPGIIKSILTIVSETPKGITVDQIVKRLVKLFPERDEAGMHKTVNAQLGGKKRPCRMEREKKVTFNVKDGKFSLKVKKTKK